jgi:hypothetical protein
MLLEKTCSYCGTIREEKEKRCLSCGAPLAASQALNEPEEKNRAISAQILALCVHYEENESCHAKDTLPKRKLNKVRQNFEIPSEDDVLFVYDGTLFGSSKLGFALCQSGIYWKNDWTTPTKINYLAWSEFKEREIKPKKKDFYIGLGRGDKIGIVDEDEIKDFAQLLKDIQTLL